MAVHDLAPAAIVPNPDHAGDQAELLEPKAAARSLGLAGSTPPQSPPPTSPPPSSPPLPAAVRVRNDKPLETPCETHRPPPPPPPSSPPPPPPTPPSLPPRTPTSTPPPPSSPLPYTPSPPLPPPPPLPSPPRRKGKIDAVVIFPNGLMLNLPDSPGRPRHPTPTRPHPGAVRSSRIARALMRNGPSPPTSSLFSPPPPPPSPPPSSLSGRTWSVYADRVLKGAKPATAVQQPPVRAGRQPQDREALGRTLAPAGMLRPRPPPRPPAPPR